MVQNYYSSSKYKVSVNINSKFKQRRISGNCQSKVRLIFGKIVKRKLDETTVKFS